MHKKNTCNTSPLRTYLPILLIFFSCAKTSIRDATYSYIKPQYDLVKLEVSSDTLNFLLEDTVYNDIKSMNLFRHDSKDYICFFDAKSSSIGIFDVLSTKLVKRISLTKMFDGEKVDKASVYVENFDSIFVSNKSKLHIFDSSETAHTTFVFLENAATLRSTFDANNPLTKIKSSFYTAIRPSLGDHSMKVFKNWKVLYEFNLENDSVYLHYNLPKPYQTNLFGYQYLSSSYCYNNNNKFVFSFSVDTNIYETDLHDYNYAYFGRSLYDKQPIKSLSRELAFKNEFSYKHYLTNNSYESIFFDAKNKRYLRVSRRALSEAEYIAKKRTKKQSFIIFDENFKIIGESDIDENINLNKTFITHEGTIYAQINRKDEYSLHFIKLRYNKH